MTDDDELLAQPGCMRAIWWSVCRGCGQRITEGDVTVLGEVDGRRSWLCRACGT